MARWSSKPVRSCSPRPAFPPASRSLALGARAVRALASADARGSSISSAFCCGAAEPRLRPTPSTRSALHHRSRLAFDAERHGPGGPAGLQNQCGRAAHGRPFPSLRVRSRSGLARSARPHRLAFTGTLLRHTAVSGAAKPRRRRTVNPQRLRHHSRLAFDAERHGPGGPAGLQNQCGRAAHGSVGSTPAPLRSRVKDGAIVLPSGLSPAARRKPRRSLPLTAAALPRTPANGARSAPPSASECEAREKDRGRAAAQLARAPRWSRFPDAVK